MLVYGSKEKNTGIPVSDSGGCQIIRGVMKDGLDIIVLLYDAITDKHYINRIKDKMLSDMYRSDNLVKIESDQRWLYCLEFFKKQGIYKEGI